MDASTCGGLLEVVKVIVKVIRLISWLIPIGLILFGLIDLGKAVIAGKEDEMKKAQGTLIKRAIYAVAVFFIVTLVSAIMGLVGAEDWKQCWTAAGGGLNGILGGGNTEG